MDEGDWSDQLRKDMRRDPEQLRNHAGRFVDFLKRENRLKDTPNGLHQHVAEIETCIRLHVQRYPISPDELIEQAKSTHAGRASSGYGSPAEEVSIVL